MGARERPPGQRPRPHPEVGHRGLPGRALTAGLPAGLPRAEV
jgi:hypothetical protein